MDKEGTTKLDEVVRVLEKEIASPLRKRSRKVKEKSKSSYAVPVVTTPKLQQSSYVLHNYMYQRVIVEGLAWLNSDDEVVQATLSRLKSAPLNRGCMHHTPCISECHQIYHSNAHKYCM